VSTKDGQRLTGRCPDQVSVEQAQEAARACALNVLAQIESAAGLDQVEQITQVNGFVLCTDDFGDQPKVMNAASDLLVDVRRAGRRDPCGPGDGALPSVTWRSRRSRLSGTGKRRSCHPVASDPGRAASSAPSSASAWRASSTSPERWCRRAHRDRTGRGRSFAFWLPFPGPLPRLLYDVRLCS
jgi:hypothetical protein